MLFAKNSDLTIFKQLLTIESVSQRIWLALTLLECLPKLELLKYFTSEEGVLRIFLNDCLFAFSQRVEMRVRLLAF